MKKDVVPRLLENDIKALVLNKLIADQSLNIGDHVFNEFTIDNFSRRADLLILRNNKLHAFEIKSEVDNLDRLDGQLQKYSSHFDKVTIVAHSKHIPNIRNLPENTGLWEVRDGKIKIIKKGHFSKITTHNSLLSLMNLIDLLRLARNLNIKLENKSRTFVSNTLLDIPHSVIRNEVISSLRLRYQSVIDNFWENVDHKVCPEHLPLLSRFKPERDRLKNAKQKSMEFWGRWQKEMTYFDDPFLYQLNKEANSPIFGKVPSAIKKLISKY